MKFEIFKDADGWHWRLLAATGKVIAVSPEPFATMTLAEYGADGVVTRIAGVVLTTAPGDVVRIPKEKIPVAPEFRSKKR